ncbi:golgin candidate 2 [Ipomoea triloba]|uniref:golgin candidate 2 n=1 Tax=Ipomoea triloba TaxID=35885 RepID=UPI00125E6EAC|nr:golgin candidate 2 [Ipomoea triloba]
MAHWISSKLKAAENILQQIDQQAAESLKKGEKARSDGLDLEISATPSESKPLKDQLKKKTPENKDFTGKLRDDRNLNAVSSENSKNYGVSSYKKEKEVVTPASLSPKPPGTNTSTLTDADWTELLSVPNKSPTLGTARSARISNRAGGVRGLKKDSRIQGSLGSGSSLLPLDGKKSQKSHNNVPKSSREPDGQLGNKGNDSARDGRLTDGVNVSAGSSSAELKSDGDSSERDHSDGRDEASDLLHGNNDEKSIAMDQHVDVIKDGDVGWEKGAPIGMESATINGQLDLKMQTNDNQRFKNGPTVGSQSSLKIRSSSPSDRESDSETDSTSSSGSGSEREREERRKRRQQILAEKAAAKAIEAIREREDMVAKLEGEKQSLEKILEVRAKQQAQEASELQTKMMETMEAVELEKQKHNSTRMETLARLAKLETANAELAKSLATAQWNLEVEVNHVTELRQQIELKEAAQEELRRKISQTKESGDKLVASKGVEFEREILEAEYSFLTDKVGILQEKAKTLETSIDTTKRELESPTEVEVELKRRLGQLTDHLIQKQAQVESLSSQKATLLFKIEAVSRTLDENKSMLDLADIPSTSSTSDLESGDWSLRNSKLKSSFEERMHSGQQHFWSLVWQLDSIFSAGAVFLRRNSQARIWSLVYLACLHLWVIYILRSNSSVSEVATGAAVSLENINNTARI